MYCAIFFKIAQLFQRSLRCQLTWNWYMGHILVNIAVKSCPRQQHNAIVELAQRIDRTVAPLSLDETEVVPVELARSGSPPSLLSVLLPILLRHRDTHLSLVFLSASFQCAIKEERSSLSSLIVYLHSSASPLCCGCMSCLPGWCKGRSFPKSASSLPHRW